MKVKNYVMGDFGGISYNNGDYHTVGQSGLGSMGFSLNDVFSTVFGQDAQTVKATLQSGAASVATNIVGSKLATNQEAKQGIVDTVKASVSEVYSQYKIPIIVIGGSLTALMIYGIYNAVKKK